MCIYNIWYIIIIYIYTYNYSKTEVMSFSFPENETNILYVGSEEMGIHGDAAGTGGSKLESRFIYT